MTTALLLIAALADAVAVGVHGVIGHRWMNQQLRAVELPASTLFGDADVGRRVFGVTWHAVTAMFVVSAAVVSLMASGVMARDAAALRVLATLHVAPMVVALAYFARRLDAIRGRVPPVFFACMTTATTAMLLASRG